MPFCSTCHGEISRPAISCGGFCEGVFHAKCVNIDSSALAFLKSNPGFSWRCDMCRSAGNSIITLFEKKMNKFSADFRTLFDEKMSSALSDITVKFSELKSNFDSEIQNRFTSVQSAPITSVTSFAQAVSSSNTKKIIVRPKKTSQSVSATKSEILKQVDPDLNNIEINKIKTLKSGGILVGCPSSTSSLKFEQLLSEKLPDKYDVHQIKSTHPRVRIVGLSEQLSDDVFIRLLRKQNSTLFKDESVTKVISFHQSKKNTELYSAVLQLDSESYLKLLTTEHVLIGYDSCAVYDAFPIARCYNCNSFNHMSRSCPEKNGPICPVCAEKHAVKDCKASKENYNCCNCINLKKIAKIDINVSHAAWNYQACETYKRTMNKLKQEFFGTASPQ